MGLRSALNKPVIEQSRCWEGVPEITLAYRDTNPTLVFMPTSYTASKPMAPATLA